MNFEISLDIQDVKIKHVKKRKNGDIIIYVKSTVKDKWGQSKIRFNLTPTPFIGIMILIPGGISPLILSGWMAG